MSEPVRDPRHNGNAAEILSQCLQAIESGRETLESCVAAHPEFAELEDLLQAVGIVQELPRPLLTQANKLAIRGEVLAKYRASARPVRSPEKSLKSLTVPRWFRAVLAASLILTILLGGGAGLVRAAEDTLPGDSLYGVKRFTEQVQLSFADSAARSVISYSIAERRLGEVTTLAARNQPISEEFLTDVADSINLALAVQPDMGQRAALVSDAAKAIDQAQSAGVIKSQAKEKIFARLNQPPAVLATAPATDPTKPQKVIENTAVPADSPTVQVASVTVTPSLTPTATIEASATPTDVGTEVTTKVAPLVAVTSTPTKRPTVVKPRPTGAKATPNNANGNGNNAGGNPNGNNAGGNGNGNSNAGGNGNGGGGGGGGKK